MSTKRDSAEEILSAMEMDTLPITANQIANTTSIVVTEHFPQ